uniref:Uncharacterized protein n=1 Tax=Oryza punctata TaxID=4537 RepID=A0A0E0JZ04_ORYPU
MLIKSAFGSVGNVEIPAHYPSNPRVIGPPPRPVEIHHSPPSPFSRRSRAAAAPPPVFSPRAAPAPPLLLSSRNSALAPVPPIASASLSYRIASPTAPPSFLPSAGAASLSSPVLVPPPFLPASFPRAKKFRNKPFPIFEALGELYDGQIAEGLLNFTSLQPTITLDQSRNTEDDIVTQVGADDLPMENNQDDLSNNDLITASEHAEMEVSNQLNQRR